MPGTISITPTITSTTKLYARATELSFQAKNAVPFEVSYTVSIASTNVKTVTSASPVNELVKIGMSLIGTGVPANTVITEISSDRKILTVNNVVNVTAARVLTIKQQSAKDALSYRNTKVRWDFGDGTILYSTYTKNDVLSESEIVKHTYKYAGKYTVTAHIYNDIFEEEDRDVNKLTTSLLTITDYYSNKIEFTSTSPSTLAASTGGTFTVSVTSNDVDSPLYITIYPKNSLSAPSYSIPNKWSFINRNWSLQTVDKEDLTFPVEVKTSLLKIPGTDFAPAVTGTYSFIYTDDSPSAKVTLSAAISSANFSNGADSTKIDFSSHSNSINPTLATAPKIIAEKDVAITAVTPTRLLITENYLNNVYPVKWAEVPIPLMITLTDLSGKKILDHPLPSSSSTISTKNAVKIELLVDKVLYAAGSLFKAESEVVAFDPSEPGYVFTSLSLSRTLIGLEVQIKASISYYNSTTKATTTLEGLSNKFVVNDLADSYQIAKINEEFDYASHIKSLLLPQHLQNNEKFIEFIGAAIGNGDISKENIGSLVYEKIANFVSNHSDFETAEVKKLISLAAQVDVESKSFLEDAPRGIERLVNLLSIPKHRLRGKKKSSSTVTEKGDLLKSTDVIIAEENYIISKVSTREEFLLTANVWSPYGDLVSTYKNHYTASNLKTAFFDSPYPDYNVYRTDSYERKLNAKLPTSSLIQGRMYCIIEKNLSSSVYETNLSKPYNLIKYSTTEEDYSYTNLKTPLIANYDFFEVVLKEELENTYTDNIINWNSENTDTIKYENSSYEEWYGKDKLVELLFNNILTKSLFADKTSLATEEAKAIVGYPTILQQPEGGYFPKLLSVVAIGTAPLYYQWYNNDIIIEGATEENFLATRDGLYTVVVTNAIGTVTSDAVLILEQATVPRITKQPIGGRLNATTGEYTLSVTAEGTAPLTYQWYIRDEFDTPVLIDEAFYNSYTTNIIGKYFVIVSNSAGEITSIDAEVIDALYAPVILTQPVGGEIVNGKWDMLVVASGLELVYQWKKDGNPISGATSSNYAATQPGTYTVVVSNGAGFAISQSVSVTPQFVPVTITTQPVGGTLSTSNSWPLSVTAAGTGPFTYQWKKDAVNISNNQSFNATAPGDYYVVITDSRSNTVTSTTVKVYPRQATVTINNNVSTLSLPYDNTNTILTANVTGTGTFTYQWYFNNTSISGATNSTFTIPKNRAGSYKVVVSQPLWKITPWNLVDATSNIVTVTLGNWGPVITTQPIGGKISTVNNETILLTVVADGTAPLSYQWKKDGTILAGAINATYSANTLGRYTVEIKNVNNTITSNTALIEEKPIAPSITVQPVGGELSATNQYNLSVTATGTAPLSYQWRKDGANIAGATTSAYIATTTGSYSVVISNSGGSVTSGSAVVTEYAVAPVITTDLNPIYPIAAAANNATLTVVVKSTTFTYTWYSREIKGGPFLAINNQTEIKVPTTGVESKTITLVAQRDFEYFVEIRTTVAVSSKLAKVGAVPVVVSYVPPTTSLVRTSNSLVLTANGTAPLSYQWRKNGTAITNAIASGYIPPVGSAGTYDCVVSNPIGNVISNPWTVQDAIAITTQPVGGQGPKLLSVTATGTSPSYQWKKDGTNISGATSSTYNAASGGDYTVVVSNGVSTVTSSTATVLDVWTKGTSFKGAATDSFGPIALSRDGNVLAIGSPDTPDSSGRVGVGKVVVKFKNSSGVWTDRATILGTGKDLEPNWYQEAFGSAVAINSDGSVIAVTAPEYHVTPTAHFSGVHNGILRIYRWNGSAYIREGEFAGPYEDRLGLSVAINDGGNTVAVSSSGTSPVSQGTKYDYVRIYKKSLTLGTWTQIQTINYPGTDVFDSTFGYLSMSGDGIFLTIGQNQLRIDGSVHFYKFNSGTQKYDFFKTINGPNRTEPDSGYEPDDFGRRVALNIDGTKAIIGAPGSATASGADLPYKPAIVAYYAPTQYDYNPANVNKKPYTNIGHARSYILQGVTQTAFPTISQIGGYILSDNTNGFYYIPSQIYSTGGWEVSKGKRFGTGVAMNSAGTRFVIGSPGNVGAWGTSGNRWMRGQVEVFELKADGSTSRVGGTITLRTPTTPTVAADFNAALTPGETDYQKIYDNFGARVCMSGDGNTIIVSAPSEGEGGEIIVYTLS